MKRFFILALVITVCVTFCCCQSNTAIKSNGPDDPADVSVPSFDQSDIANLDSIAQRDIHSIEWRTVGFTHGNSNNEMKIVFPDDWSFEKSGEKYNILRNGKLIGNVSSDPSPIPQKKYKVKSDSVEGLKYNRSVHKNGDQYTYCICFTYTDDTVTHVTIEVDYAEFCDAAVTRLVNDSMSYNVSDNIRGDFALKNCSKQLVVCGNSFIGSSQIIQWFNQMCKASDNGYSLTSGTAWMMITNGSFLNEALKNGEFAAILLCGFYSSDQEDLIEPLKELCKQTNTLLIIFPAHNENPGWVSKALSNNPDLCYIGWKDEIQALIDLGVDYYDMCIEDTHQHTTHLGGYVGAHMIYRALFEQMPPKVDGTYNLTFSDIKSLLGNYVTTGNPASVRNSSNDLKLKF